MYIDDVRVRLDLPVHNSISHPTHINSIVRKIIYHKTSVTFITRIFYSNESLPLQHRVNLFWDEVICSLATLSTATTLQKLSIALHLSLHIYLGTYMFICVYPTINRLNE